MTTEKTIGEEAAEELESSGWLSMEHAVAFQTPAKPAVASIIDSIVRERKANHTRRLVDLVESPLLAEASQPQGKKDLGSASVDATTSVVNEESGLNWVGDLEDDCFCSLGGFTAHCEGLCDQLEVHDVSEDRDEPFPIESWFVGVYRDYTPPAKDSDIIFHSGEHGGLITSGEMARAIGGTILKLCVQGSGACAQQSPTASGENKVL